MPSFNRPHLFLVVKVSGAPRVFASWFGGYMGADEWRMSSAIQGFEIDDGIVSFRNLSGSTYTCRVTAYGASSYASSVVANFLEQGQKDNLFSVYPTFEDFLEDWPNIQPGLSVH